VADGVIHTAFIHDFSKFKDNCETDRRAVAALGSALVGSDRPLIVTSATGLVTPGRVAIEEDVAASGSTAIPRVASEEAAAAVVARGVRVSVVRLPPSVHGDGDHAFVPHLIAIARQKGVSAQVGDGLNRWPAVHRLDAARLYRLVLRKAAREPAITRSPKRDCAPRHRGRDRLPPERAGGQQDSRGGSRHFGWFAHFAALDNPASSRRTRELLGWQPTQPASFPHLGPGAAIRNLNGKRLARPARQRRTCRARRSAISARVDRRARSARPFQICRERAPCARKMLCAVSRKPRMARLRRLPSQQLARSPA